MLTYRFLIASIILAFAATITTAQDANSTAPSAAPSDATPAEVPDTCVVVNESLECPAACTGGKFAFKEKIENGVVTGCCRCEEALCAVGNSDGSECVLKVSSDGDLSNQSDDDTDDPDSMASTTIPSMIAVFGMVIAAISTIAAI